MVRNESDEGFNLRSSSDSKITLADSVDQPRRNGDEGDTEL